MTIAAENPIVTDFVRALASAMAGEVDSDARRRAEYSTDASNYAIPPQVVAFPKDADDVAVALAVAREHSVPLTARGAGTSCAGNAIGPGLVLDFSRHMNRILAIDPETRTAVVQPGTIMGALQKAAAPHGLRFGPDPSTWTRATLGGMIGNNACGPHAVAWGRTADNVRSLDLIDGTGRALTAAQNLSVVPGLGELVAANLAHIRTSFGRFKRQVSGYSLEHLLPENGSDLARMLSGSEGTLGILTAATVDLVPIPDSPVLAVLGYPTMADAADAVPALLAHKPLAIEGIDSRLVEVVRRAKGPAAVPELPAGAGWLLVEVGGEHALARAEALVKDAGTAAVVVHPAGPEASALWQIRADGAGLGGRTPSGAQGWPGWEDAAVPPERLGRYLREFEALMAAHDLDGLLYGHFGDGCVHVRIDFPLQDATGVTATRRFLEEAADMAAAHGGSLSGEHGDGRARSELLPRMYSAESMALMGNVKALFDPHETLNPGVLVGAVPLGSAAAASHGVATLDTDLRRPRARSTGAQGFSFGHDGGDFTDAVHRCTGVAKCRAAGAAGGFMCPSYKATGDEKDVTRGRARVLQEVTAGRLHWASSEVTESLDMCLSCKACSTDCPAGVDMARYKSEVTYRNLKGKLRPRTHYLLGWLPRWATLIRRLPGAAAFVNWATSWRPFEKAVLAGGGMDSRRQFTRFETDPLAPWWDRRTRERKRNSATELRWAARTESASAAYERTTAEASSSGLARPVLVWADSFSQSLDSGPAKALIELLESAGYDVLLAPSEACCGLTWISTGQLDGAKKKLSELLRVLGPLAVNGIPIVGVEPSCTAVLRDDLPDLLPEDPRAAAVAGQTFTLAELLVDERFGPGEAWSPPNLSDVEIVAQPHCHHYSVMGWRADAALLARAGATVRQLTGCCGLAGNFGMEKGHYDISVAVAETALLPALRESPDALYLADGFSCRTQAEQLAGKNGVHLAELLLRGAPRAG